MKLYNIKELEWNFKSSEVSKVTSHYGKFKIYIRGNGEFDGITISREVFEFFQRDFPEHCFNIEPDEFVDVPF